MKNLFVLILSFWWTCNHLWSQSLLQQLPQLNNYSLSFQQSSYDRTGLNIDYISPDAPNYYDAIPAGKVNNPSGTAGAKMEYVVCHIQGPAVLERFWMITFPPTPGVRLRFYFDGESTPRINETFEDLFLIQKPPYNKPLVQEFSETSGGNYSYLPIPVAQSLIMTIDMPGMYYQFQIRQLPRDTVIQSWTPEDDQTALIEEFNASSIYPKNNWLQTDKDSIVFSLSPEEQRQLFRSNGQKSIEAIQMQIPDLDYSWSDFIKDNGQFHKGVSRFRMNIDGSAQKVLLVKRSNKTYHAITKFPDLWEQAVVRVNSRIAGNWRNTNYRAHRYWQNDTFEILPNFYRNQSQINLQLNYLNGEPWSEYYYWVVCDGVITDSLNVGTLLSEEAHNYSVTNVQNVPYNEINNRYDAPESVKNANRQILDSLYIHIYFDNETTPSVSAPAGLFFATGVNDAAYMKSIPCGNVNGWYYNYFTMPFWENARVMIANRSSRTLNNITSKWAVAAHDYAPQDAGYFKSVLRRETKEAADTTDYLVADIHGRGVYVGTVMEVNQNDDTITCWLEGDEFIYVDGAQTPSFYGTGTEDYFNSTFYFYFDEYSMPQNGMTNSDKFFHRSMYRFHLSDPIYFEKSLRFQIEHGDYNNKLGNYQSLAFYYWQPSQTTLTDSFDVGNPVSESLHQYTTSNARVRLQKTAAFETGKYVERKQFDGYAIPDSSVWRAAILPENKGVRLLRQFDYSYKNQRAKVYVDDMYIGEWLNPGVNQNGYVRDDFFDIPAQYTSNKSFIRIKIINASENTPWTELYYEVHTRKDTSSIITGLPVSESQKFVTIYPTVTRDIVQIKNTSQVDWIWQLCNRSGQILQQNREKAGDAAKSIHLGGLPAGMYFIRILQYDHTVQTEKVILVR